MKIFRVMIFFVLTSCHQFRHADKHPGQKPEDGFYTDPGDWDDSRIPLIRPYELIKLKGQKDWGISLQTPMIDVAIHNVDSVNVIDSVIIVHSGETNLRGGVQVKQAWFVLLPGMKEENGYAENEQFVEKLTSLHIRSAFFVPDKLYSIFLTNKKLDWTKMAK